MYFETINEIIHMAGHGAYVWTAYGISALVLGALVVMPIRQYRKELMRLRDRAKQSG